MLLYGGQWGLMWNIIRCEIQGSSHIKENIPCQDNTYSSVGNDTYVIALADGAGSARLSHYGSEIVTKFICSELTKKFERYFSNNDGVAVKHQLINILLEVLTKKAEELNCEIKELASTLLFVAVKDEQFIIAHIGDGVIGYLKDKELKIVSHPENGEFINTTVFTTSKDVIVTMKLIKGNLKDIKGFVLMSDGTETSLYDKKEQKIAVVLKRIMEMATFIPSKKLQQQLEYSFRNTLVRATTDDCSIAMLVKRNKEFNGYMNLSHIQKCKLLHISINTSKRLIKRYDDILNFLAESQTIAQTAKKIHLKSKHTKKYINKLCRLNFIEEDGERYQTIVIMNSVKTFDE